MSAQENMNLVRRFVEAAQGRHDLTAIDAYLSPDFVDHSVPPGLPPNREGVKLQFAGFLAALPDLSVVIHDQIADDEKVVTRKTLRGAHLGELFGAPPTGKTIEIEVIDIVRIQDGLITDHWNLVDRLGVMQQLGLVQAKA
jgi:steroid delta-isomerase-like uncharacterized protein